MSIAAVKSALRLKGYVKLDMGLGRDPFYKVEGACCRFPPPPSPLTYHLIKGVSSKIQIGPKHATSFSSISYYSTVFRLLFGKTKLGENRFPDRGQIRIQNITENRIRCASGPVLKTSNLLHTQPFSPSSDFIAAIISFKFYYF